MYRKLDSIHLTQFDDKFFCLCLFQLGNRSHRFWTHDVASPVMDLIKSVIVIGLPIASSSLARALSFSELTCVQVTCVVYLLCGPNTPAWPSP